MMMMIMTTYQTHAKQLRITEALTKLSLTSGVADVNQKHDAAPNVASCVSAVHRLLYLQNAQVRRVTWYWRRIAALLLA